MRPGERERGVGEPAREGLGAADLRRDVLEVGRVQAHAVAPGDGRPTAVLRARTLHRALDATLHLDRLDVGAEQASRGALEDAFEEAVRRQRSRPWRATVPEDPDPPGFPDERPTGRGTTVRGPGLGSGLYSGPARAGQTGHLRMAARATLMTEILTESFCERCGTRYTFESAAPRRSRIGKVRTLSKGHEELRPVGRFVVLRGDGRRAQRAGARRRRPPARRFPPDVQLLPHLPPVHVR